MAVPLVAVGLAEESQYGLPTEKEGRKGKRSQEGMKGHTEVILGPNMLMIPDCIPPISLSC